MESKESKVDQGECVKPKIVFTTYTHIEPFAMMIEIRCTSIA